MNYVMSWDSLEFLKILAALFQEQQGKMILDPSLFLVMAALLLGHHLPQIRRTMEQLT